MLEASSILEKETEQYTKSFFALEKNSGESDKTLYLLINKTRS